VLPFSTLLCYPCNKVECGAGYSFHFLIHPARERQLTPWETEEHDTEISGGTPVLERRALRRLSCVGRTCQALPWQSRIEVLRLRGAACHLRAEGGFGQGRRVSVERGKASGLGRGEGLEEHAGRDHAEAEQRFHEVLERRRRSVLTCERGLSSALASSNERLVRRWARSLRDAEKRLVWAEADLRAAETKERSA
jgi:hypothetical protein